jgi:predicted nucleic acid-binding protein
MVGQITVITDASVLINFLVIDKVEMLVSLPGRQFVITDHVKSEVTAHYPDQLQRLELSLSNQHLTEISVVDPVEVGIFAALTQTGLGIGECSAIAVAQNRGHALAIDDKTARKRVAALYPAVPILTTELIVLEMIQANLLTITAADAIKLVWEQNHRFKLPFGSFSDRITS